jgi:hypothetical protein
VRAYPALNWLVPLAGLLAAAAAFGGLFWRTGGQPVPFTTLHGQQVILDGDGLYAADTVFTAGSFRGTDAVTLLVFIPLLAISFWAYRRGSLRGGFLLAGSLGLFVYLGATMSFAAAYNAFFLVYVALLAASFFTFILAFTAIDLPALPARLAHNAPRRGLAAFLFLAGLAPFGLWLADILGPLAAGRVPGFLASYTTMFTYAIDLAIIVPAAWLAAWLVLRRAPLGYLLGCVMLMGLAGIGAAVVGQTWAQLAAGIEFSPGQLVGYIGSWIVLAAVAVGFVAALLRGVTEPPARQGIPAGAVRPAR